MGIISKIKSLFKKEAKHIELPERVEKRFIASASQHGARGQLAKMAVYFTKRGAKIYGWAGMYDWLKGAWNVPPMDLTFGRSEPIEEFEVVHKGIIEMRETKER